MAVLYQTGLKNGINVFKESALCNGSSSYQLSTAYLQDILTCNDTPAVPALDVEVIAV